MKSLFLILTVVFGLLEAQAQTLTPMAKLNRVSKVVRGHDLAPKERAELKKAIDENRIEAFFHAKVDEFLKSEAHAFKMSVRLEELFLLRTSDIIEPGGEVPYPFKDFMGNSQRNSMNHLFTELARKNLSWDQLLTGKTYRLFPTSKFQGFGMTDIGFMAALVPNLNSSSGHYTPLVPAKEPVDVTFKENDLRIAGSITTGRFFTRFVNTGLNKNRKRAAAIFRTFLCDSMSAAVTSSEGKDDEILDLMFPHNGEMTEADLKAAAEMGDAAHGARPDCMACHSKLDPMGRTLLTSPLALHPLPVAGKLSFPREKQDRVEIPVRGIGELGTAITQQPEYVQCQVRHFWGWFIDKKIQLTPEIEAELVREFNRVGRRTNDFVKILLARPEFSVVSPPLTDDEIRARQVKQFLKKCQDCHRNITYEEIPDFTAWPIGGSKEEMKDWIGDISKNMDLDRNGERPKMPPVEAAWRSSFKEIQLIKDWIKLGAPNEKGERMLE